MTKRSVSQGRSAFIFVIIALCFITGCTSTVPELISPPGDTYAPQPVNLATFPTPERAQYIPTLSGSPAVSIEWNDFEPFSLVIMNGTTVTWTNNDPSRKCSVVSDSDAPEAFQSGTLTTGESFQFRFTRAGSYRYHSSVPPEISGEIIVL